MSKGIDLNGLSRAVSHALRHEPWLYELELDEFGWVEVDLLLAALRTDRPAWSDLEEGDLKRMIAQSSKSRCEMKGSRIRALYGHSTAQRLTKEQAEPPATLYHGTSGQAAKHICATGLRPMGRQYVHLSVDIAMANQVGQRKAKVPVILVVRAADAAADNVAFYRGNDAVWLADFIPAQFIDKRDSQHRVDL